MNQDYRNILLDVKSKLDKSFVLVQASVEDLQPFDIYKDYTPKALEPYDALSDRFIRCIEVFIRFFRSYELYKEAVSSSSFRDGLNKMEKFELISDVTLWLSMRDVRNKVVHDYLPEQTQEIFDQIMNTFYQELVLTKNKIDHLTL